MVVIHGPRLLWLLRFDISNTSGSLSLRFRWQMGEERVESYLVGHLHLHSHISLLLLSFQQELVARPNLCKGGWGKYSLDGQPLPSNKKYMYLLKSMYCCVTAVCLCHSSSPATKYTCILFFSHIEYMIHKGGQPKIKPNFCILFKILSIRYIYGFSDLAAYQPKYH